MSLDDSLRATFRNYSTFFLVVFAVLMPLHLIYGSFFHDVLAVRELHPAIAEFPPSRQVRGVGQTEVERARLLFWVLVAIEIALVPLLAKACRAVLDRDARGEIPTVGAAWASVRLRGSADMGRRPAGEIIAALAIAVVVIVLAEATLRMAARFVPDGFAFAALAFASAAGRAAGLPFLLVPLVTGAQPSGTETPELY